MRIEDAKAIFREEMDKHGLHQWKLVVVDLKATAGWCQTRFWHELPHRTFGTIALSTPFMSVFDEKEVRETARHEVAHALTDPKFKAHGPEWKRIARRIGSTGDRCVSVDAPKVASKYTGTCPQGHKFAVHRRLRDMHLKSRYCPKCYKQYRDKERCYIEWVDNTTRTKLNSVAPVQRTLDTSVPVRIAAQKVSAPARKKAPAPAKDLTWKDKFDRGMTSFGDDW